jgi:8-oxo-dGTP pyrophosphatase MutT (NUDIX family)
MPKDDSQDLPIKASEIVFKGRIWDVAREAFIYNGQELVREFVVHPGAVAVVAIDEQNRVLLLRQYRHPVRSYLWELPAGLLDVPGEDKQTAARRELLEESGYEAKAIEPLIDFYTTPGGNSELISIFLARDLKHVGHDFELEGEEVDMPIEWVPIGEAVASILRSEIKSPSAAVGIMAAALQLGVKPVSA